MKRVWLVIIGLSLFGIGSINAGNPGMMIRCGANLNISEIGTICGEGYVAYLGHCYPLAVDGVCASVPGFAEFKLDTVTIFNGEAESYVICIPDCSTATSCDESCIDEPTWDYYSYGCFCDNGIVITFTEPEYNSFCGCPPPFIEPLFGVTEGVGGICQLPVQNCYNLGLDVSFEPLICDDPDGPSDTIRITIKPAGGGNFQPGIDAVTIEDLENCNLLDGSQELLNLVGQYDGGNNQDRLAFVADASGCIVIEFTRDPNMDASISFLGNMNLPIVIPACPRAFDPCSCRVENITAPDGTVLLWYDELSYTGTPGAEVIVLSNNNPLGFLDLTTQIPVANGIVLSAALPPSGILTVPFYRTPGELTDVTFQEEVTFPNRPPTISTTDLISDCTLSPSSCATAIVPTMGEWAIISLSLLLLIIGVIGFNQNNQLLQPVKVRTKNK